MKNVLLKGLTIGLFTAGVVLAQAQAPVPANPTPGCSASPAQVEANKKVAMSFFALPPSDLQGRLDMIDPTYRQHNPAIKQAAEEAHVSDAQQIQTVLKGLFGPNGRLNGRGGGRGRGAGPQPPPGNQFEVVTAECDIVTIIHKNYRPDPKNEGKFYEAFTFDAFRVKNGKLTEHWDNAVINPPAPAAGAPGRGQ